MNRYSLYLLSDSSHMQDNYLSLTKEKSEKLNNYAVPYLGPTIKTGREHSVGLELSFAHLHSFCCKSALPIQSHNNISLNWLNYQGIFHFDMVGHM